MASLRDGLFRISGGTCWRTMRLGEMAVADVEMMLIGTSWVEVLLSLSVSAICHVKFVKP